MPVIGFGGQNLCLAYIMLNKTYSRHKLSSTKPIPGIHLLCWIKPQMGLRCKKSVKQDVFRVKK